MSKSKDCGCSHAEEVEYPEVTVYQSAEQIPSFSNIAHRAESKFDKLSPRLQTEFMTKAGLRSFDLLQYLKGARPSVDKNTNINLKNSNAILQVLESSKHPMWPMVKEGDVRNFKFAELDAFFVSLNKILTEYMSSNSIDLILDKKNIIVSTSSRDISNEILQIVDRKLK